MTAGFLQATRAEWTKVRSVRGMVWLPPAFVGLTVVMAAVIAASNETNGCPSGAECDDVVQLILSGSWIGQLVLVAFAAVVVTSEYATGLIRATFAATPRRRTVLAAKAALVAAVVFCAGLVASVASFFLGRSIVPGSGFTVENGYPPLSLADGATFRAVVGTGLYLAAVALLALGLGAIVRHTAGAVTAVLGLLFGPLIVAGLLPERIDDYVQKLTPPAGLAIQQTVGRQEFPIGPWAGFGVLCAYAAAALLAAFWQIGRRDA